MAFHRESYGGKRVLSFRRVMVNKYILQRKEMPLCDKRQTAGIIPNP